MSYRWKGRKNHTRAGGEVIKPGQYFEPTRDELRAYGDLIQEVVLPNIPPATAEATPVEPAEEEIDVGSLTIHKIQQMIADGELDATEVLEAEKARPKSSRRTSLIRDLEDMLEE